MDAALLMEAAFWQDSAPLAAGDSGLRLGEIPELEGHVLFPTSGSTGAPKWVALSKRALRISAAAVNAQLGVGKDSRWGLALPLHHVGGFSVAARAHEAACGLQLFPARWEPLAFHQWLTRSAVTHTALVPTQVHDLVRAGLRAPATLRAVVVGGGNLAESIGLAARALAWPVLASFGMTEAASQIATQTLDALENPYQPAPLPVLPIWRAQLTAEGTLALAGDALFSGYLVDGKFVARAGEFHVSSDRVALNERWLTPLGRADALVKVLGELVDPLEIERELVEISGGELVASRVAVLAIPDARAGQLLVPVFEAPLELSRVTEWLAVQRRQSPGFRRLQPAAMVAEFPRSELGKLRRAELLALYLEQAARPEPP
jgi:O-succinylbenzoic acid--CoA ligase